MSDCEGQVCILGEKPAGPGENGMTETCGSFTLLLSKNPQPAGVCRKVWLGSVCSTIREAGRKSDIVILKDA